MTPTTAAALVRALAELPDDHRQALLLTRAGMSFLEVADRLGQPVERIRTAVHASVVLLTQARLAALPVR
ncbi:MAG: sigma factor-like helix-turn-helix DNA-binding protein [Mycobacteriales bacterium]